MDELIDITLSPERNRMVAAAWQVFLQNCEGPSAKNPGARQAAIIVSSDDMMKEQAAAIAENIDLRVRIYEKTSGWKKGFDVIIITSETMLKALECKKIRLTAFSALIFHEPKNENVRYTCEQIMEKYYCSVIKKFKPKVFRIMQHHSDSYRSVKHSTRYAT